MTSRYCSLRAIKYPTSFYSKEVGMKLHKSIYFDFNNITNSAISFKLFLSHVSNPVYLTRVRRRCVVTGRSRSIDKESSFSRFVLKSRTIAGACTGFKKSS